MLFAEIEEHLPESFKPYRSIGAIAPDEKKIDREHVSALTVGEVLYGGTSGILSGTL